MSTLAQRYAQILSTAHDWRTVRAHACHGRVAGWCTIHNGWGVPS